VYQLSGGIQRYLEAFPDGGFFHGENFVFDEVGMSITISVTVIILHLRLSFVTTIMVYYDDDLPFSFYSE